MGGWVGGLATSPPFPAEVIKRWIGCALAATPSRGCACVARSLKGPLFFGCLNPPLMDKQSPWDQNRGLADISMDNG